MKEEIDREFSTQESRPLYTGRHLAFLVPTKDRPAKLANLLESLARQDESCGRVIIIDGGKSVEETVMAFADRLPVEYYECRPPGQIRQRNMGIDMIDQRTPLVCFLDDDIVLEEQALKSLITLWNECDPLTAGISFNIMNSSPEPRSWLRYIFGLCGKAPGRVLRSGMPTSNCQATRNLRTQWLCGGATSWKFEILKKFTHREISSRWAIGEDVIFSYPIGKQHPLYVCADARVRHEHQADYVSNQKHRFHGLSQTLWVFYFVESNKDLSRLFFLWMLLGSIVGRFIRTLITFNPEYFQFALGQIEGAARGLSAVLRGVDISTILEAKTSQSSNQPNLRRHPSDDNKPVKSVSTREAAGPTSSTP